MAQLGIVNIDGLDLSGAMRNDLAGGMTVAKFNSKYSSSPGFRPIGTHRQVAGAPAAAAPAAAPGTGPTSQPLNDFAAQFQQQQQALIDKQNREQEGLFTQYEQTMKNQEALPSLYQRLQNELGIGQLSQGVQGFKNEIYRVQGLLDRLGENVTSRNLGTYATQAMRDRILAKESGELQTELSRLGMGMAPMADLLVGAQGQLANLMPLYMQEQNEELKPLEMRINATSERFAREITGFTTAKEQQLTAILDEITRGRQLADRDWELAQKLAAEEREFSRNMALAKQATSAAQQYLMSQQAPVTTPTAATIAPKLPSIAKPLSVQPASSGAQLQGSSPKLQGSSPVLQGSNSGWSLQGGSIRLQ